MRHALDSRQSFFRTVTHLDRASRPLIRCGHRVLTPSRVTSDSMSVSFGRDSTRFGSDETSPDESQDATLMMSSVLPTARFFGCTDLAWSQPTMDVASCQPGDLVVYRIGEGDPNQMIADAMARGAGGILTEQILPCPIPQCIVSDVDSTIAKIAAAENDVASLDIMTIGVIGDSGKTSTSLLIATLTNALGIRTAFQCDLGSSDGVVNETIDRKRCSGAELIGWLREASDCCSRMAVVEINEREARDGRYECIPFDMLVVTSKHETSDDYGPSGLQCLMDRLKPSGIVIVPERDQQAMQMVQHSDCHYVTYGTGAASDFGAIMVDQSGGMATLMLSAGDTSAMMETPLCGTGMSLNIAAAATLGSLLGHSLHDIARHLNKLRSIPGRGQRLIDYGRSTVVLETGGTPDRVVDALKTAKATGAGGRVWCVLAVSQKDDESTMATLGHHIERFADHCVVTSRPGDADGFLKRSHQLLDGVRECAAIRLVADQNAAITWAIQSAKPRDTVVVITGRRDQTASEARTELTSIEALVEKVRGQQEAIEVEANEDEAGQPITLKLFP